MMKSAQTLQMLGTLLIAGVISLSATLAHAAPVVNWSHQSPSEMLASSLVDPARAPVIAATNAGDNIIAVGEYGTVLILDGLGNPPQQADEVPTRAALTAVSFIDQRHGWAVGHQGVILRTRDGGRHWSRLQADSELEALFSVHFEDEQHGFAGGRFATLLETRDGGEQWQPVEFLPDPEADETHLFDLFGDGNGRVYATSEFGRVFARDRDGSWQTLETGFGGSLWGGIADADGNVVVVGMVGAIYRSEDFGATWEQVELPTRASFTDIVRMRNGNIVAVGLNGVVATSTDNGRSFEISQREDRAGLTAVACAVDATPVLFSKAGVLSSAE